MRDRLKKIRDRWWVGALLVPLAWFLFTEIRAGFGEGTGWGPRQLAEKAGKWFTEPSKAEKPKVETGSIPQPPSAKPDQTDTQKKEAAARARRARCEKERNDGLLEAEKELAVLDYRARSCVAEMKQYLFTRSNPEAACKEQIDAKTASGVRRDAVAGQRC